MKPTTRASGAGDGLEGRYANYFEIGHNAFEFILDFGQSYFEEPGPRTQIHSRIVISASYIKMLQEVLQRAISQHGQRFDHVLEEAAASEDDAATGQEPDNTRVLKIIPKKNI